MTDATAGPRIADAPEAAARLERAFRDILETRMQGVPILNAALSVEAVGLRDWQGCWLGALVTPWFINLMALPGEGRWQSAPDRDSVWYAFPAGRFEFIAGSEPGLGPYHACSLFSPVQEFGDQETARETARVALESLFDPALLGESSPSRDPDGSPISRRDFLRGAAATRT
jgi:[NiFe] hydrogenase assembly HybE family chaperone